MKAHSVEHILCCLSVVVRASVKIMVIANGSCKGRFPILRVGITIHIFKKIGLNKFHVTEAQVRKLSHQNGWYFFDGRSSWFVRVYEPSQEISIRLPVPLVHPEGIVGCKRKV